MKQEQTIIEVNITTSFNSPVVEKLPIIIDADKQHLFNENTLCKRGPENHLFILSDHKGRMVVRHDKDSIGCSLSSYLFGRRHMRRFENCTADDFSMEAFNFNTGRFAQIDLFKSEHSHNPDESLYVEEAAKEALEAANKKRVQKLKEENKMRSMLPITSIVINETDNTFDTTRELLAKLLEMEAANDRKVEAVKSTAVGSDAICPNCGDSFTRNHNRTLYCSSVARPKGDKTCGESFTKYKDDIAKSIKTACRVLEEHHPHKYEVRKLQNFFGNSSKQFLHLDMEAFAEFYKNESGGEVGERLVINGESRTIAIIELLAEGEFTKEYLESLSMAQLRIAHTEVFMEGDEDEDELADDEDEWEDDEDEDEDEDLVSVHDLDDEEMDSIIAKVESKADAAIKALMLEGHTITLFALEIYNDPDSDGPLAKIFKLSWGRKLALMEKFVPAALLNSLGDSEIERVFNNSLALMEADYTWRDTAGRAPVKSKTMFEFLLGRGIVTENQRLDEFAIKCIYDCVKVYDAKVSTCTTLPTPVTEAKDLREYQKPASKAFKTINGIDFTVDQMKSLIAGEDKDPLMTIKGIPFSTQEVKQLIGME